MTKDEKNLIEKALGLAQYELKAMYKRLEINDSSVLTLLNEALRVIKKDDSWQD